jgi:hypothetical protein
VACCQKLRFNLKLKYGLQKRQNMANTKFLKVSLIIIIISLVILNGFLAFQVVKNGQIQETKLAQNVLAQNSSSQISVQTSTQISTQNSSQNNFQSNSQNNVKLLKAGNGSNGEIEVLKMTDCNLLISYNKRYLNPYKYNSAEAVVKYNDQNNSKSPIINFTHFAIPAGRRSGIIAGCVDFVKSKKETIIAFIMSVGSNTEQEFELVENPSIYPIFASLNKKVEVYKIGKLAPYFLLFDNEKVCFIASNSTTALEQNYRNFHYNLINTEADTGVNPEIFLQFVEPNSTFSVEYKNLKDQKPLF